MEVLFSTYFLLACVLFGLWSVLFFFHHALRREMLLLGFTALALLPILLLLQHFQQEEVVLGWNVLRFVDFWVTFSLAGIAGVSYHVFLGKHYHAIPRSEQSARRSPAGPWLLRFFLLAALLPWITLLLHAVFPLSIAASLLITASLLALYISLLRTDLFFDSVLSGFLTAFVVLLTSSLLLPFTGSEFTFSAFEGARFLGTPVDLLVWSFALGLFLGPIYEFVRTLELK